MRRRFGLGRGVGSDAWVSKSSTSGSSVRGAGISPNRMSSDSSSAALVLLSLGCPATVSITGISAVSGESGAVRGSSSASSKKNCSATPNSDTSALPSMKRRISLVPLARAFPLIRISSFRVSFTWHIVHNVRKFARSASPPPSETGTMWSACQNIPSLGSVSSFSNFLGSAKLACMSSWYLIGGSSAATRRKSSCASRPHNLHTPRSMAKSWTLAAAWSDCTTAFSWQVDEQNSTFDATADACNALEHQPQVPVGFFFAPSRFVELTGFRRY
mmetsp:Transcript_23042/g.50690  ORF Transcript_23042/g.50690 Transcript_23042/m.50690 type:complete len:273 (-) Transcript_23042:1003-1821(-)